MLTAYLNQFNNKKIINNIESTQVSYINADMDFLTTKWISNSAVNNDLFEPLDRLLKEDNHFSQTMYEKFIECKIFAQHKDYFLSKHTNLKFYEQDRYNNFDKTDLLKAIHNLDSIVKINLWRRSSGDVYFYDIEQKYFVVLAFRPSS